MEAAMQVSVTSSVSGSNTQKAIVKLYVSGTGDQHTGSSANAAGNVCLATTYCSLSIPGSKPQPQRAAAPMGPLSCCLAC